MVSELDAGPHFCLGILSSKSLTSLALALKSIINVLPGHRSRNLRSQGMFGVEKTISYDIILEYFISYYFIYYILLYYTVQQGKRFRA